MHFHLLSKEIAVSRGCSVLELSIGKCTADNAETTITGSACVPEWHCGGRGECGIG